VDLQTRAKSEKHRRLLAIARTETLVKQAYRSTKFAVDPKDSDAVNAAEGVGTSSQYSHHITHLQSATLVSWIATSFTT